MRSRSISALLRRRAGAAGYGLSGPSSRWYIRGSATLRHEQAGDVYVGRAAQTVRRPQSPRVEVEGGSYPIAEAHLLLQAITALIEQVRGPGPNART